MARRDIYRWKLKKPWQRVMVRVMFSKSMSLPIITHAQPIRLSPCNICERAALTVIPQPLFTSAQQVIVSRLCSHQTAGIISQGCNLCVWPTGVTSAAKAEFYCCLLILHLQLSIHICVISVCIVSVFVVLFSITAAVPPDTHASLSVYIRVTVTCWLMYQEMKQYTCVKFLTIFERNLLERKNNFSLMCYCFICIQEGIYTWVNCHGLGPLGSDKADTVQRCIWFIYSFHNNLLLLCRWNKNPIGCGEETKVV